MLINKDIEVLINKITATYLTKGVQPSELAEAIFINNYHSINMVNDGSYISLLVSFSEFDGLEKTIHCMRYTYDSDQYLIRVDQKVNKGKFRTQWDREQNLKSLISDLTFRLSSLNELDGVLKLIETLPHNLRENLGYGLLVK